MPPDSDDWNIPITLSYTDWIDLLSALDEYVRSRHKYEWSRKTRDELNNIRQIRKKIAVQMLDQAPPGKESDHGHH